MLYRCLSNLFPTDQTIKCGYSNYTSSQVLSLTPWGTAIKRPLLQCHKYLFLQGNGSVQIKLPCQHGTCMSQPVTGEQLRANLCQNQCFSHFWQFGGIPHKGGQGDLGEHFQAQVQLYIYSQVEMADPLVHFLIRYRWPACATQVISGQTATPSHQVYTVKAVLRDHCHERPPVLKDHQFWQKVLHSSVYEPVTKDHLS